jgi:hypothetical protein
MNHTRNRSSFIAIVAIAAGLVGATPTPAVASTMHHGLEATVWSRYDNFSDGTARLVIEVGHHRSAHVLTHPPLGAQDINPMISPNGKRVLFERDQPDGTSTVGLVGSDGRGERVLDLGCTDPCGGTNDPAWAPDGRQIVYERVIGPFTGPNQDATSAVLYRSNTDGSHLVRLSEPGIDSTFEEAHPHFSPAGYLVVVRVKADGATAIFRLRADGSHPHQLTPWSARADLPFASPAASGPTKDLVTFETEGVQGTVASRVATVPATCGSLPDCTRRIRYLTPATSLPDEHFNPAWSADGRRILSVHFSAVDPGPAVGDIESTRFDGTDRRSISTDPRFEYRPFAAFIPRR